MAQFCNFAQYFPFECCCDFAWTTVTVSNLFPAEEHTQKCDITAIAERCEAISVTSLFAEWTNICRVYCEMLFDVPRPPVDFLISHQSTAINILKNGSTSVSKASKCFSKSTNIFPLQSASALYEYFASYINNHMTNVCYPDFRLSRFHIEICV